MLQPLLLIQAIGTIAVQVVCVALVAIFLVCCCISWLHVPLRCLIRPAVVFEVENGLEWVLFAQRFQTKWLTMLFELSSQSVSVAFYVSGGQFSSA
jgi:hypothetical protein